MPSSESGAVAGAARLRTAAAKALLAKHADEVLFYRRWPSVLTTICSLSFPRSSFLPRSFAMPRTRCRGNRRERRCQEHLWSSQRCVPRPLFPPEPRRKYVVTLPKGVRARDLKLPTQNEKPDERTADDYSQYQTKSLFWFWLLPPVFLSSRVLFICWHLELVLGTRTCVSCWVSVAWAFVLRFASSTASVSDAAPLGGSPVITFAPSATPPQDATSRNT